MNFSKKALLVLVMGSLVSGSKVQAAEKAASVLLPIAACCAAAKYANMAGDAGYQNVAKAGAALSWAAWVNWINSQGSMSLAITETKNDLIKIGLLLGTVVLANSKNALALVDVLKPTGLDALLSDPNGTFGFGTLARNIIPYLLAKKACEKAGILDKE